jgi:uncharacterized protein
VAPKCFGCMKTKIFKISCLTQILFVFFLISSSASGQRISLDPPGKDDFVSDKAGLINEEDLEKVLKIVRTLSQETATPIVVVTIDSMVDHGGRGMSIEGFSHFLFNQWGVGYAKLNGEDWNTGILLVVSKGDRKARIELGASWGHEKDQLCKQIMDEQIIPNFKQDKYSEGILAGVYALEQMARGKTLPKKVRPWWRPLLLPLMIGLTIFTIVSLIRRGASGWAWVFWAVVFAFLWLVLINMLRGSGGGSGGGFSGGGGASGSW